MSGRKRDEAQGESARTLDRLECRSIFRGEVMSDFGPFGDAQSNRTRPREQEGFAGAIGLPSGHLPCCGTAPGTYPLHLRDTRGPLPNPEGKAAGISPAYLDRRA